MKQTNKQVNISKSQGARVSFSLYIPAAALPEPITSKSRQKNGYKILTMHHL